MEFKRFIKCVEKNETVENNKKKILKKFENIKKIIITGIVKCNHIYGKEFVDVASSNEKDYNEFDNIKIQLEKKSKAEFVKIDDYKYNKVE
jgi:hypothetical protein